MKEKSIILALLLSYSIGIGAFTGEAFVDGVWYYIVTKTKTAEVIPAPDRVGVNKSSGDITIPSTIEYEGVMCSVKIIRDAAFKDCYYLNSIIISEGITSIGESAFDNCYNLVSASLPNSVTSIGKLTFWGCKKLESVNIPQNISTIYYKTFYNCSKLSSLSISKNLNKIENDAFYGCSQLKSVYISDLNAWCDMEFANESSNPLHSGHLFLNGEEIINLTFPNNKEVIGDYVFSGCAGIESVYIPDNIISIGKGAFSSCSTLKDIHFSSNIKTIGESAFSYCYSLTHIEIPKSVLYIGNSAFAFDEALDSMTIPEGVTTIGEKAFQGCSKLESVSFNNDTNPFLIGSLAFYECSNLKKVFIKSLKNWCHSSFSAGYILVKTYWTNSNSSNPLSLAKRLFVNGEEIEELVLPNDVTSIGERAFVEWDSLKSINIPLGVTTIEKSAFEGCKGLTSVSIPKSVTYIGPSVFYGCDGLTAIHITDLSAWCKLDFSGKDQSVYYETPSPLDFAHHLYLNGVEITNLIIPNGITSIGKYCFHGCYGLTSVTVPSNVAIDSYAFRNCKNLSIVVIGNNCSVEDMAFANCPEIIDVYSYNENVPTPANNNMFSNSGIEYATLHVPSNSISLYSNAYPWKTFKSIIALKDDDPKPSGIKDILTNDAKVDNLFTVDGKKINKLQKGLNIVRMSDGTTKKVVLK